MSILPHFRLHHEDKCAVRTAGLSAAQDNSMPRRYCDGGFQYFACGRPAWGRSGRSSAALPSSALLSPATLIRNVSEGCDDVQNYAKLQGRLLFWATGSAPRLTPPILVVVTVACVTA